MLKLEIAAPTAISPASDPAEIEEWRDNTGKVCAFGYQRDGDYWIHMPPLASYRFDKVSNEVMAVPCLPIQPELITDTYYRSILPLALQARGQEVLHASGVVMPSGVVAFCAISETGKSTLAYAFAQRGYQQWADDAILFTRSSESILSIQLPFAVRLRPSSATHFGRDAAIEPVQDWTDGETKPLAVVCVLSRMPDIAAADTPPVEVRRIRAVDALTATLPHAYCFSLRDIERKRQMMQNYMALVMRTPIFEVRFRKGLEHLPAILDAIEQSVCH